MALPKEPRQKMINIMYLVLTAILALNVSAEILNAFKTVDNSLRKTNTTVNASTTQIFQSLTDKLADPATKGKAEIWLPRAKDVMSYSTNAYNFIEGLKNEILVAAGGDPKNPAQKFKEDNLDVATRLMITQGKGKQLLQVLTDYKKNVLGVNDTIMKEFANSLQIDLDKPKSQTGDNKKNWEESYFHMIPTVAALTILSKFQNDIKTSENKVVTFCHEQVGKVQLRFDAFEAIVGQNSTYLMPGQEIEITAGLGAFSKQKLPTVTVGGASVPLNEKGQAVYKSAAGGVGSHTVNVTVAFTDQDGNPQTRTIPVEYTVGSANASIALDKMNVLYIGVDNPVTIAASGGGDDKVNATISGGGSLTRVGPGKYIARVSAVNDNTIITVSVDGKVAGASQFRVRTIPEAQAYVGGQPSGANIAAGAFKAQGGVGAGIKNFPFELSYDVVSFTFTCDTDDDIYTAPVSGASFGPIKNQINTHVQAGRMVTIDNIRVKGPDGRTTSAPSLVYYIK